MVIDFSGNAGEIREAFHTEIHELDVDGERHFANMSDPKIPAALAPAIVGVVSMHNFKPHALFVPRSNYTFAGCGSDCFALVPADFQTIYNLTPLYSAGITGSGETVAVVEDTNSFGNDWKTYQTKFGLTSYGGTLTTKHPNSEKNCTNPGININGDDGEADLDVEMVTAFAPGAKVERDSCADGATFATFGGLIAIENLVNEASPPPIVSMSYGVCEAINGASANAAFLSAFQTAAGADVSVFVSSGDSGASTCSHNLEFAITGIGVTGWGETIYNVSVGGTDFEDVYNASEGGAALSTYWNSTNSPTFGSAKSYIPEIPWNDSCASFLIYHVEGFSAPYGTSGFCNSTIAAQDGLLNTAAGSGGPSGCATGAAFLNATATISYIEDTTCQGYAKPPWQTGIFGNPADGVRDIPDVSLFAGNGVWGHYIIICYSDSANGGVPCTGDPSGWYGVGGTSAAAPAMAAIQALIDQKWNKAEGNPNPTYYAIAKSEFGSTGNSTCYSIHQTSASSTCKFYDITQGDNDVTCRFNSTFHADCYRPTGTNATLGTQAISSLTLNAGGSGYTTKPTCTISLEPNKSKYSSPTGAAIYAPGVRATCTATINATTGKVTAVTLINKGRGYTGVPTCTLSGGGGTGAVCMAVITPTTGPATYQPTFGATPGWDMATGIGSVNATNLVMDKTWQ